MSDTTVSKILMTEEQAAERESDWDHRPIKIAHNERVGQNGMLSDGRYPGETYFERDLRGWRSAACEIAALEVIASSAQPCDHRVTGLWVLRDPPPLPPPDCPFDHCMCYAQPIFPDEVNQREIFGWHVFDSDGRFMPLSDEIKTKPTPQPTTPEEAAFKSTLLSAAHAMIFGQQSRNKK